MIAEMLRQYFMELDQRYHLTQSLQRRLANRRFWRNTGLLMLANLIVMGLGLIRTPLMTWVLPKNEIGMLGVVASWLPFLQLASLSGMDSATFHYVSKGQPWTFVYALFVRFRWSLLSAIGFLVGAAYWAIRGEVTLAWLFVITGVSYPVTIGMTASAGMLAAQERYKSLFWYRIFESLTDFTGFIPLALTAFWISKVVTFYATNQVATAIQQTGVSLFLAWQLKKLGTSHLPQEDEREFVRYSKHLTAISGISVLQARTDAFLVGAFETLDTMADYSIALLVSEQFKRLWGIYVSIRYPPLVRMPLKQRRRRFIIEGSLLTLCFFALGMIVALLAHWLIPLILPPSYARSLGYMDLLIATSVIGVPGAMAEIFFRTQQDERRQYMLRTVAAGVGVLAPLLLVFRWGAYGAATGRLIANLVFSTFGVWLFTRQGRP
jgi:O-antigen/teichoic acid export membrane protein